MNKACQCYTIYWDNILIGFRSYLYFPNGTIKYAWRGSRLVILPDYQNLGFGTHIMEFLGEYYLSQGYKYFDKSSHLRLIRHWNKSNKWKASSGNGKPSNPQYKGGYTHWVPDTTRITGSFEYMGKNYIDKPHIEVHIDDNSDINYDIFKQDMIYLKEKYYLCVITGEINTPSKIEDICLELGIRTQLLYNTKKGIKKIANKYKDKKIITKWDEEFSQRVRRFYTNNYDKLKEEHDV